MRLINEIKPVVISPINPITLTNPKNSNLKFTFNVYDLVRKRTVGEIKSLYIERGYDDIVAYNMALSDYEEHSYIPLQQLHFIDESEKKSIPSWVKDKPVDAGKFYWRASSFQFLEKDKYSDLDYFSVCSLILLGNLKEGDVLPIKLKPEKMGHSCEYLTFVKYNHKFPTGNHWIHSEKLIFNDREGKSVCFNGLPYAYYTTKNLNFISGLSSVLSYWSMCRLNNNESLFGDLFKIIQRELCFYQCDRGELGYNDTFLLGFKWKEKPFAMNVI